MGEDWRGLTCQERLLWSRWASEGKWGLDVFQVNPFSKAMRISKKPGHSLWALSLLDKDGWLPGLSPVLGPQRGGLGAAVLSA